MWPAKEEDATTTNGTQDGGAGGGGEDLQSIIDEMRKFSFLAVVL